MSGRATLATARLRLATPATRISVARTSPARLGPLASTLPRARSRCRSGRGCGAASRRSAPSQPQDSWMWPQTASRGRFSSIARSSAGLPKWVPSPALSQWPWGGECRTSTAPSGQGASIAAASSSSRSKLQSQGVTGMPAPRPKNSTPSIVVPSPCRTVAASQPRGGVAQRVDGLVVAGDQHGRRLDRRPAPRSSPPAPRGPRRSRRRRSRRRPRPTSRPARAPCSRSRCRSLKASSFTPGNLSARGRSGPTAAPAAAPARRLPRPGPAGRSRAASGRSPRRGSAGRRSARRAG